MYYYNYVNLCNKRNISPSAAAEEMGFHRSDVTRWSKGSQPRQATMQRIADYFGVSVAELTSDKEKAPASEGEHHIGFDDFTFAMYNETKKLPQEKKDMLLQMARFFNKELEKKEKENG